MLNVEQGHDCGAFVCMYADFIANDYPLVFTQSNISDSRDMIAVAILKTKSRVSLGGSVDLEDSD